MSDSNVFLIDGEVQTPKGNAKIEWSDRRFFTVYFNGKKYKGEILEQNLENHFLKLKLNHRVFEVKRKYALLDLISQLGLDKQKVKRLKELNSLLADAKSEKSAIEETLIERYNVEKGMVVTMTGKGISLKLDWNGTVTSVDVNKLKADGIYKDYTKRSYRKSWQII